MMPSQQQSRWQEISDYLDEALELDEPELARWLAQLDTRAPETAAIVRSLLSEKERVAGEPLLNDPDGLAGLAGASLTGNYIQSRTWLPVYLFNDAKALDCQLVQHALTLSLFAFIFGYILSYFQVHRNFLKW